MKSRLLPIVLAAALLAGGGARATDGLDLSAVKDLVDAGAAAGGTGPAAKAYARLSKSLALPSTGLPGDLSRLRAVAGACAGALLEDDSLRSAVGDALDAGAAEVRALDAAVLGAAGDLVVESHRNAVLAKAARARALERLGEASRVFGADATAAALFRRSAAGLAGALKSAERLAGKETPKFPVFGVPVQGRGGALLGVCGEPGPDPRLYVVGAADTDGPQFLVLHPGAEGWVRVPVAASGDLWWVAVVPGDAAWSCGTGGRVVRYDPATGELEDRSTGENATLFGIWGSGPSDIWAVGGDPDGVGPRPALLHWDGDAWSPVAPPPAAEGKMLYKVWGTGSGDVWAVGEEGTVLHFDGGEWTSVASGTGATLLTVSGPDPVVAVGGGVAAVAIERQPNGTFLSRPVSGVSSGTGGQTGGGAVMTLNGVFASPVGAPLAVGFSGSVVRRGTTGWTGVPAVPIVVKDLHAVWMDDAGNAVMVGGKISTLKDGQIVTYGRRRPLPSTVAKRARFRDGISDLLYLDCAHSACHLPPFNNAGLAIDDASTTHGQMVGVASTQASLLRVFPGRPSQSYLWHKLLGTQATVGGSGDRMPTPHVPGDGYLTDGDMEFIRGWILDGARDN